MAGGPLTSAVRVARFLHGRARFSARPDDVFISSYPRSGTTWLQQMLVVLTHGGDPGGRHISEHAPWFERTLAHGSLRVSDFDAMAGTRVFKSHLPLSWLPRGARYVYAVRDGRDVAVSYFHLYRSHLGFTGSFEAFLPRFFAGTLQYGSWFDHVAGWEAVAGRPDVLLVRYEAMRADLVGTLRRLSAFCGLAHDEARLQALSAQCTFDYMKAREDYFDHATETGDARMARGQFVRAGRSGGHDAYFDAAAEHRFAVLSGARRPRVTLDLPAFLH